MTRAQTLEIAAAARHLAELLEASVGQALTPASDLTIEQLAEKINRSASTVRGWCERGLFAGAYHLPSSGRVDKRGRERVGAWRIPSSAVEAFRNRGTNRQDVRTWRAVRKGA